MLNFQLENQGGYSSKPTKFNRLILVVILVQVSFDKVSSFDGLNSYFFVVSISFPIKYWTFPCLGLRQLTIKPLMLMFIGAEEVYAIVLLRLIMVPLLTYFLGFLVYQS